LVPLFYSNYEPKFIKHMLTDCDCFAYERIRMFWECSTKNYMKSCFNAIIIVNNNEYSWEDLCQFTGRNN